MNILFYRYNSICESSIISVWKKLGYQVTEITEEMENKSLLPKDQLLLVSGPLILYSVSIFFRYWLKCAVFLKLLMHAGL